MLLLKDHPPRPPIRSDPVPIRRDAVGELYLGSTRVSLYSVLYAYLHGAGPKKITEMYDVLDLADVYYVIGYYLRHRREMDVYLRQHEAKMEKLREDVQKTWPPDGMKERLLARKKALQRRAS